MSEQPKRVWDKEWPEMRLRLLRLAGAKIRERAQEQLEQERKAPPTNEELEQWFP